MVHQGMPSLLSSKPIFYPPCCLHDLSLATAIWSWKKPGDAGNEEGENHARGKKLGEWFTHVV